MGKLPGVVTALGVAVGVNGCAMEAGDEAALEESVRTQEAAIINGADLNANSFNVAIWHWSHELDNWFPRPCSGTILRRTATQTVVLTARHCVTNDLGTDDYINAPLLSMNQLRLTTAVNPGVRSSTTSKTVTPSGVTPSSMSDFRSKVIHPTDSEAHDAVLLYVNSVLATVSATTPSHGRMGLIGLHRGPLSELTGLTQRAFGYGRNQMGTNSQMANDFWAGGAGQLRTAVGLEITGGSQTNYNSSGYRAGYYDYINDPSTGSAGIINGDSGGASYISYKTSSAVTVWNVLAGVHSTVTLGDDAGTNAAARSLSDWIQSELKWLSLSPARYPQYRVYVSSLSENANVRWTTSTNNAGLYYNGQTRQIRPASDSGTSNFCMEDFGSGSNAVRLATCESGNNAQRWSMLSGYRIRNVATNECMYQVNAGTLATSSCTTVPENQFVWSTVL